MDKSQLTERDICTKYITPALLEAGWDLHAQIREEVSFTKGRIIVRGRMTKRGEAKRADYILYFKPNIPIAVVEAKDNSHHVGSGMQQALQYAEMLDIPFAFSSNGDAFLVHDRTATSGEIERELMLDGFPSPDELWERYRAWKGLASDEGAIVLQDYYSDGSGKSPRYYQINAINRTVEAIARGQQRILLVMATGTGKTYTAFQIIWRLWKSKTKRRILFLADRNILVDQTRTNDFKPFGKAMTKITGRKIDTSYEIYLALYQAVSGTEAAQNVYREFSPTFFDLIVVDECHRGSAADDSAWREILEYFSSATQIGLTATPKETADISNRYYFGDPVYTYSLRQGIEDGFLAPYKVVRIDLDIDQGYTPTPGQVDRYGNAIEERTYNQRDINVSLVVTERDRLVARKISEFLKGTDRFAKTIVFCEDIEHAGRMRKALVNENADLAAQNARYVMQITGDNVEGKSELDNFILPDSRYPVIVTTSRLLTTGVDVQTCKLIVLDRRIQSMTEFKQIIGRGTRIYEAYDKLYFTIMDFKKATELFADPEFDGDPVQVYTPSEEESPVPPDEPGEEGDDEGEESGEELPGDIGPEFPRKGGGKRTKYYVDGVEVRVVQERVQYYSADGRLITESLKDFTRSHLLKQYTSLDAFLNHWSDTAKKRAIIAELEHRGILLGALADEVGRDYDPFDLVCHVAFDRPPLTRRQRADKVRQRNYFAKYGEQARAVLEALLEKYAQYGIERVEDINELATDPIRRYGTKLEIVNGIFGGKPKFEAAVRELEEQLYQAA
jgi:type I restriction enzyme, R subunit